MTHSMESHCIGFREIPHTTKLLQSFLDDFSRVSSYYSHPPTVGGIDAASREVRLDPGVRSTVVDVLREQNRRLLDFAGDISGGVPARVRVHHVNERDGKGRAEDRHRIARLREKCDRLFWIDEKAGADQYGD